MLYHQPWLRLGRDIRVEFEQCLTEGRDVEKYRAVVDDFCKMDDTTLLANEDVVTQLAAKMASAPFCEGWKYVEPSGLAEIFAEAPAEKPVLGEVPADDELLKKLSGAWIGRIAGCLLGKPIEGWRRNTLDPVLKATGNYPMERYICQKEFSDELVEKYHLYRGSCFADNIGDASPVDDDTNYTTFAMKLVENYGRDFRAADVMEGWMRWIPILATCTAERAAYRNAAMGLLPPETAVYKNPYREWIGAQIRGDFFGYINPGDPETAADMAFRDASISHVKNGIYGEMYIAAMIAAAAVTNDMHTVIEAGLAYIPAKSRLTEEIRYIVGLYDGGMGALDIIEEIHKKYNEHSAHDWCSTIANAMIVTMALLCGEGDFGRSICLAVQSAFDTDCNGATVGSILGIMLGEEGIDPYWYEVFHKAVYTSIEGYNRVDVDFLAKKTLGLIKK